MKSNTYNDSLLEESHKSSQQVQPQKIGDNQYRVTHNNNLFNINVESGGIFDKEFNADYQDKRAEIIDKEFRTSTEIENEAGALHELERHNAYLLDMTHDLDNLVVINKKRTIQAFKDFAKRSESMADMYETKGSFFQSETKSHYPSTIIPNNEDLNDTEGELFANLVFSSGKSTYQRRSQD